METIYAYLLQIVQGFMQICYTKSAMISRSIEYMNPKSLQDNLTWQMLIKQIQSP